MDTPAGAQSETTAADQPRPAGIEFYGGFQVYSERGVDLTSLRENLKRTVTERLENNRRAAAFVEGLKPTTRGTSPRVRAGEKRSMFDAEAILRQLTAHQVEFIVVGGFAMVAHGSDSFTKDLDICYARTTKNIAVLVGALAPLRPYLRGAPPELPFRLDAPTILAGLNFTLTTDAGDLDLLGEVSGVGSYEAVLAESVEKDMYGMAVRALSLEGLIAAKQAAGRRKDQIHLMELEDLKKERDANQPRS